MHSFSSFLKFCTNLSTFINKLKERFTENDDCWTKFYRWISTSRNNIKKKKSGYIGNLYSWRRVSQLKRCLQFLKPDSNVKDRSASKLLSIETFKRKLITCSYAWIVTFKLQVDVNFTKNILTNSQLLSMTQRSLWISYNFVFK